MNTVSRYITFLCLFIALASYGQENDSLFLRLQGISNHGIDFFNVDGIEITSQKVDTEFTPKNISNKFRQLKIKEKELTISDSLLDYKNYYVLESEEDPKGFFNNISFYFVESTDHQIIALTFVSLKKPDKDFERTFVNLVRNNAIPKDIYNSVEIDSINFAGRKIPLRGCIWMGINNVQCHSRGQMNWSVHKSLDDAQQTIENHFATHLASAKGKKAGKIVSDTLVDVIFEGTEVKAKKVEYKFTGVKSLLLSMEGGKVLTIYFVAAPVRGNFVSCVMSLWDSDEINPSGLPPLLEQVMKLK